MNECKGSLQELIDVMKESARAQIELTQAIARQTDAIVDLLNALPVDDDDYDDEGGEMYL